MIKKVIKKILPKKALLFYHWFLSKVAVFYYANPSQQLIVVGVTGTNGKTTTVNFIAQFLEGFDQKVGLASTVNFKVAEKEWLNNKKMTMLGRFQTQKLLKQMVQAGCQYAVIETSSQGIEQFRHQGINYDLVVFTNLTPEHIEAHGSFENYRAAKEKLFQHLSQSRKKIIGGKKIRKIIIANSDDEETERLRKYQIDKFITYGFNQPADYYGANLSRAEATSLISFKINQHSVKANLIGKFSAYNLLASLTTIKALGFPLNQATQIKIKSVPGRQELIDQGQNFKIMIDYAPEPVSLSQLYKALKLVPKNKIIHVLGSCGGGRDQARQPNLGQLSGQQADFVIVTNEDPYDDDPWQIIENVAQGVQAAGKIKGKDLFTILDRKEAIKKALELASKDDLVLITGKGAEQFICVANDQVVRKLLRNTH